MEFDENKAIDYIKAHVENPDIAKYDDDDILLVIDTILNISKSMMKTKTSTTTTKRLSPM